MTDLRTAAQQALAFTMRDFASLRDFEAAKAVLHDNLRAALAEPVQCADNDSPWLICKPCAAEGVCKKAEPVQEPVGVVTSMVKGGVTWHRWPGDMPDGTTLFTAPPQRPAEPTV